MTNLQEHLLDIDACQESREWVGTKTAQEAWDQCEHPDWLFWWAKNMRRRAWWAGRTPKNSVQSIVLAGAACARTLLRYVPADELRPLQNIEAAERWSANPTEENRLLAAAAVLESKNLPWFARATIRAAQAAAARTDGAAETWATQAMWSAALAAESMKPAVVDARTMCVEIRKILVCPV